MISGPGFFNLDASIFKQFKVTERMQFEVRGEAFLGDQHAAVEQPRHGYR